MSFASSNMVRLEYPIRQSIAFSNKIFELYRKAIDAKEEEILFDLSRTKSLTPFGIVMLTATIDECRQRSKHCSYRKPKDTNLERFLNDSGFNKYFGLEREEPAPDRIETGTIQMRRITGLDTMFIETMTEIFDYHLNISPRVKGSLWMSLQETMINAIDHSGIEDYYVCAWTYPEKRQLRLCIADLGIGIRKSLWKSPEYRIRDDYRAIKKAIEQGVSCRSGRDGLGLCHIRNFLNVNEGQMCIISGKGKVYWKFDRGETLEQQMKIPFDGTIVKLIVNIDKEGFYFLADEKEYLF